MDNPEDIKKLIAIKQRHLQKLKEKEAVMGISTDAGTLIQIEDLETEINELRTNLSQTAHGYQNVSEPKPASSPPAFPPPRPTIFISYSHKDEIWKDRLMTHLQVLALEDKFDIWEDRQIAAGDDWFAEIEQGINQASLAVLLVTANFLISEFIRRQEVSRLLERRRALGMRIYPIIVAPCPWQRVDWLAKIQVRPKDGKPLASGNEYQIDETLSNIALEIEQLLNK